MRDWKTGGEEESIFDRGRIVMRASAGDFEAEARVKTKRRLVGSANFEERFFCVIRPAPVERFAHKRRADAAPPRIGMNCEIQNFEVLQNSPRDEESCHLRWFFGDPPNHFAARNAFVIPGRPLRDFWTEILDFEDAFDVGVIEQPGLQEPFQ